MTVDDDPTDDEIVRFFAELTLAEARLRLCAWAVAAAALVAVLGCLALRG